jgi:hypothetical protein
MDWFEKITGFREASYDDTRASLKVSGQQLQSLINGKSYGIGQLELVPLHTLRERVKSAPSSPGRLQVSVVSGDVRQMHKLPENNGALFQVASQFNLLEMVSPSVTPEHGVTRYQADHTQGPACAIAAGAATIYRNYFAPVGGSEGQTRERQLDGLAGLGEDLSATLSRPVEALWEMRNGYALCTRAGLDAITEHFRAMEPERINSAREALRWFTSRCRSHRRRRRKPAPCYAGLLLRSARCVHQCAGFSLGTLRVTGLGGVLRSYVVRRRAERAPGRFEHCSPHKSRRRRFWQRQ